MTEQTKTVPVKYTFSVPDNDGMIEVEKCPVCGGTNLPLIKTTFSAPFQAVFFCGGYIYTAAIANFAQCQDCKLVIQSPRMSDERIDTYYKDGFYWNAIGIPGDLIEMDETKRVESIMQSLEAAGITEVKRHLDIGSDRGILLDAVKEKYGAEAIGYDLSKGHELPEGKFDLVSSTHCLEHCPYPLEEMKKYREYASKYLLLEVPGYIEPQKHDYHGCRFSHLYCFPPDLLAKMIEDVGFKIIKSEIGFNNRFIAEVV
jgi:hypothetical protein